MAKHVIDINLNDKSSKGGGRGASKSNLDVFVKELVREIKKISKPTTGGGNKTKITIDERSLESAFNKALNKDLTKKLDALIKAQSDTAREVKNLSRKSPQQKAPSGGIRPTSAKTSANVKIDVDTKEIVKRLKSEINRTGIKLDIDYAAISNKIKQIVKSVAKVDIIDEAAMEKELKTTTDKAANYLRDKFSKAIKDAIANTESKHVVRFRGSGSAEMDLDNKINYYIKKLNELGGKTEYNVAVKTDKGIRQATKEIEKLKVELSSLFDRKHDLVIQDSGQIKKIESDLDSLFKSVNKFNKEKVKLDLPTYKFNVDIRNVQDAVKFIKKEFDGLQNAVDLGLDDTGIDSVVASVKKLKEEVKELKNIAGDKDLKAIGSIKMPRIATMDLSKLKAKAPKAKKIDTSDFNQAIKTFNKLVQEMIDSRTAQIEEAIKNPNLGWTPAGIRGSKREVRSLQKAANTGDIDVIIDKALKGFTSYPGGEAGKKQKEGVANLKKLALSMKSSGITKDEISGAAKKAVAEVKKAVKLDAEANKERAKTVQVIKDYNDKYKQLSTAGFDSFKRAHLSTKRGFSSQTIDVNKPSREYIKREAPTTLSAAEMKRITGNIDGLKESLVKVRETIIKQLNDSLDRDWKITSKDLNPVGDTGQNRQWQVRIANTRRLDEANIPKTSVGPSGTVIKRTLDQRIDDYIKQKASDIFVKTSSTPGQAKIEIERWLQKATEADIGASGLDRNIIKNLKATKKGQATLAVSDDNLREIFEGTAGLTQAKRDPQLKKVVRSLAIPAAQINQSGTLNFRTTHGSQRGLAQFGTFETGLEKLLKQMSEAAKAGKNVGFSQNLHSYAQQVPQAILRPSAASSRKLSSDVLRDAVSTGAVGKEELKRLYTDAASVKGATLGRAGSAGDNAQKLRAAVAKKFEGGAPLNELIHQIEKDIGITAAEAVKSLDNITFKNVYDVYNDVLQANVGTKKSPQTLLGKIGKSPDYDSYQREFEKAMHQVEELMPIIEPGRPRRGAHQQNVLHMSSMASDFAKVVNKKGEPTSLSTDEQKTLIKNLNLRFNEMLVARDRLGKSAPKNTQLPVKNLSTLGIPDSQAGRYAVFNEGLIRNAEDDEFSEGTNYLNAIKGHSVKLYTDDLSGMSPFGKQFQQAGRNIAGTTNAMSSSAAELSAWQQRFGGKNLSDKLVSQYPQLRTTAEQDKITSGAYGKGYGFNVITELRHTADTFEDQILISGKLAEAVTAITKTLIAPSSGGTAGVEGLLEQSHAVKDVKTGLLTGKKLDEKIGKAANAYQEIFGKDTKYEGRADKALIENVKKTMAVVRTKDVEVQAAEIAEVFVNHFGRKFSSRFGSKGVSVTPIDIKAGSGLGTAEMPKSMGQIAAELLQPGVREASDSGQTPKATYLKLLQKELVESGNKFILDIFKDTELGVVASEKEAAQDRLLYDSLAEEIKKQYDVNIKGLFSGPELKQLHAKEIGTGLTNKTPIDLRLSSYGAGKRGLQTEVLELIMNNLIGAGPGGVTTLPTEFREDTYKRLLPGEGRPGKISELSKDLGFKGFGKGAQSKIQKELRAKYTAGIDPTKDPKKYQKGIDLADRSAELEALSNFYVDVVDELGEKRKSLVGSKFMQILQEPHQHAAWKPEDIEKGIKGIKLNLPAYASYAAIFGEKSKLLEEIKSESSLGTKEQFEYLKAFLIGKGKDAEATAAAFENLREIDLNAIREWEGSIGSFRSEVDETNIKGTIIDTEKFSTAFKTKLPTRTGGTEDFYVPGPLARGSFPDPTIAGAESPAPIARRLQNVINAAKKAQNVADPAAQSAEAIAQDLKSSLSSLSSRAYDITGSKKKPKALAAIPEKDKDELRNIYNTMLSLSPTGQTLRNKQIDTSSDLTAVSGQIFSAMKTIQDKPGSVIDGIMAEVSSEEDKKTKLLQIVKDNNIELDNEKELKKAFNALNRAKDAYYTDLGNVVIGKSGAIAETLFTRRIPSVMAKAVNAVVDKTEELKAFKNILKDLSTEYGDFSFVGDLSRVSDEVSALSSDHKKRLSKYKSTGLPILKEDELGIPTSMADTLNVPFKTYKVQGSDANKAKKLGLDKSPKQTLSGMLKYKEALEKLANTSNYEEGINNFIETELVPYVESVRFPFTGQSSVQPFKAKLMKGSKAQNVLTVPGQPAMDLEVFKDQLGTVKSVRDEAVSARGAAWEVGDADKAKRLTGLIDDLNRAISNVIPNYLSHQQKLDFDGDEIEIHSAKTAEARTEIKKHFDLLANDVSSLSAIFRDESGFDSLQPEQGAYPLAFMQKAFEKKFGPEKGYSFLQKPFLTQDASDYVPLNTQLSVLAGKNESLGKGTGIKSYLDDIKHKYAIKDSDVAGFEALTKSIEDQIMGEDDLAVTSKIAADAIESLTGNLKELIKSGVNKEFFESRYSDAIEAQLFKVHTGPETEALYRLVRTFESKAGFGSVMTSSPRDAMSNLSRDRHTQINELLRFSIQKGLDVKHAGDKTVSSEIVKLLTVQNADQLIAKIADKDSDDYGGLREFSEINEKAIGMRLGSMSTEDIRKEAEQLYKAKGFTQDIPTDRAGLISDLKDKEGFSGFLRELQITIKEGIDEGLTRSYNELKATKPKSLGGKSLEEFIGEKWQDIKSPDSRQSAIKKYITDPNNPAYALTRAGTGPVDKKSVDTMAGKVEKALSTILSDSFDPGSGAYADMVKSGAARLLEDQKIIAATTKELGDYEPERYLQQGGMDLYQRLNTEILPDAYTKLLGNQEQIDRFSTVAGIGAPRKDIVADYEEDIKRIAATQFTGSDNAKEEIDSFVNSYLEKVKQLHQIDRIMAAFKSSPTDLVNKLFTPTSLQSAYKASKGNPAYRPADSGIIPPGPVGGGSGLPPKKDEFMYTGGDIVPVHIVSIDPSLAFVQLRDQASAAEGLPASKTAAKGFYSPAKLLEMTSTMTGGINEMTGDTFENIYRASGLSRGGRYSDKNKFKDEGSRKESQVKAIMENMTGAGKDSPRLTASSVVGNALHAIIEKRMESIGHETERFVSADTEAGVITGHIDAVRKSASGADEALIDIKTAKPYLIKQLEEVLEGTSGDINEAISKLKSQGKGGSYLRQKLEDVASQLNFYLHAVGGDLEDAEAHFYSAFGKGSEKEKVVAKFKKDPQRFSEDIQAVKEARARVGRSGGTFAGTASLEELKNAPAPKEFSSYMLSKMLASGQKYYQSDTAAQKAYRTRDTETKGLAEEKARVRAASEAASAGIDTEAYVLPPKISRGEGIESIYKNLQELQKQAILTQKELGVTFDQTVANVPNEVAELMQRALTEGPDYQTFIDVTKEAANRFKTTDGAQGIGGGDLGKAWKAYKLALGEYYLNRISMAKKELAAAEVEKGPGQAPLAYAKYEDSINRMQTFIKRGLGKASDVYTVNGRNLSDSLSEAAGVYLTPDEMARRATGPLGQDDQLISIFDSIRSDLTGGDMMSPAKRARSIIDELTSVNQDTVDTLAGTQGGRILGNTGQKNLVDRMGAEFSEAWDFQALADRVTKLRAALEKYKKFSLDPGYDADKIKNLTNLIKYLQNVEASYTPTEPGATGEYGATGTVRVPKWLEPRQQAAMHSRNVRQVQGYFGRSEEEGGAKIGDRMSYTTKIFDDAGNVIRNVATDFYKYGETVDNAGEKIGLFNEKTRDLTAVMQGTTRGFRGAIVRAAKWGAASTIVYGGMAKLGQSIDILADIETAMAQIRVVMSPLETDFEMLQQTAVDFSKEYGVAIKDVLAGMRIFAQQGLTQAEVIDRTRTATLAANVTTLSAADATEALTAAMRIFGREGMSSMSFMDAWSEVEARNAITANDMANAIKKSASAAKTAGVTFDQLNGIVAAIGSTTRQTGKEVGTSMRFIFRRLSSEKGPQVLAKQGIPTLDPTGELRSGFDVLSDLAGKWGELTRAQQLNIAQAIGGTRQYNSLIVLMNQWDVALKAIQDSTNSKGSAERRNLEIMKTYTKQLQQTKAAAVELQISFGKIVLPGFKAGLKGARFLIEAFSSIPDPVKAALAAVTLFFGYLAKGQGIIQKISGAAAGLKGVISDVFSDAKTGGATSIFEVFGKSRAGLDTRGLKTVTQKDGLMKGNTIKDFHTGIGKTTFLLANAGQTWNKFLADFGTKAADKVKKTGKGIENVSEAVRNIGVSAAKYGKVPVTSIIGTAAAVASTASEGFGNIVQLAGDFGGKSAEAFAKAFVGENKGLAASLAPLVVAVAGTAAAFKGLNTYYKGLLVSSQDYEKSVYGIKRAQESELASIRGSLTGYSALESQLNKVNKARDPKVKARQQELGTFVDPLVGQAEVQKNAITLTNQLAQSNIGLVVGYDSLGNAILSANSSLKEYLKSVEKSKLKSLAATDIDVAGRHITALTQTEGPEKWKYELRELIKEAPLFGELLAKGIEVTPAKSMKVLTTRLNALIAERSKTPLATAFDKDIGKYQEQLNKVREGFNTTYKDFRRSISDISTDGLGANEISDIFSAPQLQKGYELILEIEPKFNLKETKGTAKWQDVLGAEVLRRVFPKVSNTLDATSLLTKANLETAGIARRDGRVLSGDLVTFMDNASDKYNMAGDQAIVQLKETTDGVFEWVATYFNTKTLKIEERAFDNDMQKLVDAIFPQNAIQEDLSERIEALNEFVAGAGAGLRGIAKKDFRRDFNLGERFFGDIETSSIIQGDKGFTPGGGFGQSPFQADWGKSFRQYYEKPMGEYRRTLEQLDKARLEGIDESGGLSTQLYEELTKLQEILKNNQVVFQYRAILADLTKTFEAGSRTIKENIAVEKSRQQLMKETSGLLKGQYADLANVDIGMQDSSALTPAQLALRNDPRYADQASRLRELQLKRSGLAENIYATDRSRVALDSVRDVSKGFGSVLSPDEMKNYVETVAKTGDLGVAELKVETSRVVDNTAATVERLDRLLEGTKDDGSEIERMLSHWTDIFEGEWDPETGKLVEALERVAGTRNRAAEAGDYDTVATANKALDRLTSSLVEREGIKNAVKVVNRDIGFGRKDFSGDELLQRAFGGISYDSLVKELRGNLPEERKFFGLSKVEGQPTFDADIKRIASLQEDNNKEQLISSNTAIKTAAAVTALATLQKADGNKTIQRLDDQIASAEAAGEDTSSLVAKRDQTKSDVELYSVAQALSAIPAVTMQFSKSLGFSESNIKKMGITAASTYVGFMALSKILGSELPESAKAYGESIKKNIGSKVAAGEKPNIVDLYKVKSAGKDFMKDVDAKNKELGITKEDTASITAAIEKQTTEIKDGNLSQAEIQAMTGGRSLEELKRIRDFLKNNSRADLAAGLSEVIARLEQALNNMDKKHSGGPVNYTGPHILQKGEYVLPKKAIGGPLSIVPPQDTKTRREREEEQIKEGIRSAAMSLLPEKYKKHLEAFPDIRTDTSYPKPTDTLGDHVKYAAGGTLQVNPKDFLSGQGHGKQDLMPFMASPEEFIVNRDIAMKNRANLLHFNKTGAWPDFAEGTGGAGQPPSPAPTPITLEPKSSSFLAKAIAAELSATLAGYVASKSDQATEVTTNRNKARKEATLITELLRDNPEAAQRVLDNKMDKLIEATEKNTIPTEERSLVLDSDAEFDNINRSISTMRQGIENEFDSLSKEAEELQKSLAKIQVAEQFKAEMLNINIEIAKLDIARKVSKRLSEVGERQTWKSFLQLSQLGAPQNIAGGSRGLMGTGISPQSVDYGVRNLREMSPEQLLKYENPSVVYRPETFRELLSYEGDVGYKDGPGIGGRKNRYRDIGARRSKAFSDEIPAARAAKGKGFWGGLSAALKSIIKDPIDNFTGAVKGIVSGFTTMTNEVFSLDPTARMDASEMFDRLEEYQDYKGFFQDKIVSSEQRKKELEIRKDAGIISETEQLELDQLAPDGKFIKELEKRFKDASDAVDIFKKRLELPIFAAGRAQAGISRAAEATQRRDAFDVGRRFSNQGFLNPELRGYGGDIITPIKREEQSVQQRLFARGDTGFKNTVSNVAFAQGDLESRKGDVQELLSAIRKEQETLLSTKNNATGDAITDTQLSKLAMLSDEMKKYEQELDKQYTSVSRLALSYSNLEGVAAVLYSLQDAIKNIQVQETVEGLESFKNALSLKEGLFGGGGPGAAQAVSTREERDARKYGVDLEHLRSTQYDKTEANLRKSISSGSLSGQALQDAYQDLQDIPEQRRRDEQAQEQTRQNQKLERQVEPFKEQLFNVEGLIQSGKYGGKELSSLESLRDQLASSIERAYQTRNVDGEQQQGMRGEDVRGIRDDFYKLTDKMQKDISTSEASADLKQAIDDSALMQPTEGLLTESNAILYQIAEGVGADTEKLKTLSSVFDAIKPDTKYDDLMRKLDTAFKEGDNSKMREIAEAIKGLRYGERKAGGGKVFGGGTPTSDAIPAYLSKDEYVVKASSAKKLGYGALDHINKTGTVPEDAWRQEVAEQYHRRTAPGFADGGAPEEDPFIKKIKEGPRSLFDIFSGPMAFGKAGKELKGFDKKVDEELRRALGRADGGAPEEDPFIKKIKEGPRSLFDIFSGPMAFGKAGKELKGFDKKVDEELRRALGRAEGGSYASSGYATIKNLRTKRPRKRFDISAYSKAGENRNDQYTGPKWDPLWEDQNRVKNLQLKLKRSKLGFGKSQYQKVLDANNPYVTFEGKSVEWNSLTGKQKSAYIKGLSEKQQALQNRLSEIQSLRGDDNRYLTSSEYTLADAYRERRESPPVIEALSKFSRADAENKFGKDWVSAFWRDPKDYKNKPEAKKGLTKTSDIPTMHSGGPVTSNGLHNLQKGEFVLPKAFAEGGLASGNMQTGLIPTASIDDKVVIELKKVVDEFKELDFTIKGAENLDLTVKAADDLDLTVKAEGVSIPVAVEGISIPIAVEGVSIPVAVEGISVPVDVAGQSVPVDIGGQSMPVDVAGQSVPVDVGGQSVPVDIGGQSVPVDVGGQTVPISSDGGAVGAEKFEGELAALGNKLTDMIVDVKAIVDNEVTMLNDKVMSEEEINARVAFYVNDGLSTEMADIRKETNEAKSRATDAESAAIRAQQASDVKIGDINNEINYIKTRAFV